MADITYKRPQVQSAMSYDGRERTTDPPPLSEGTQLELPIMAALVPVSYPAKATIQERFELFHAANPQVYAALVGTTRSIIKRYRIKQISIKLPYEIVRWTNYLKTQGEEAYKLSNDFTSRYARLIMDREPDLAEVFNTRNLHRK